MRDIRMVSLPVLRYKLRTFGEVGGVHFRQALEDPASTEIVFLDADGLDFSSSMGKNVERIFYKENFRRAHYKEPGVISELPQVFDFYREGFTRAVDRDKLKSMRFFDDGGQLRSAAEFYTLFVSRKDLKLTTLTPSPSANSFPR